MTHTIGLFTAGRDNIIHNNIYDTHWVCLRPVQIIFFRIIFMTHTGPSCILSVQIIWCYLLPVQIILFRIICMTHTGISCIVLVKII